MGHAISTTVANMRRDGKLPSPLGHMYHFNDLCGDITHQLQTDTALQLVQ